MVRRDERRRGDLAARILTLRDVPRLGRWTVVVVRVVLGGGVAARQLPWAAKVVAVAGAPVLALVGAAVAYAVAGVCSRWAAAMMSSRRASSPARMSWIGSGSPLTIDSKKSLRSW
jgi:hypothetical protein